MNKKDLSESELCNRCIRPAMESAGWGGRVQIHQKYPLQAGRSVVRSGKDRRDASTARRADDTLFLEASTPWAVFEANENVGLIRSSATPSAARLAHSRIVTGATELRRLGAAPRQRLQAEQTTLSGRAETRVDEAIA